MRKVIYFSFLIGSLFLSSVTLSAQNKDKSPNRGNDQLLMAVLWTQRSAEFKALCYQTYYLAEKSLRENLKRYKGDKRPAVVLDLDETVLDNSPYEAKSILTGMSYPEGWNEWCNLAQAKAIPGAVEFLLAADKMGVEIFYISNRREILKESTIKNLAALGLPNADSDHVLLRTDTSSKDARRKRVEEKHEILLLVGDNLLDMSTDFEKLPLKDREAKTDEFRKSFGTRYIVMPNAQYGEWLGALFDYDYSLSPGERLKRMRAMLISY